jgi:type IV secretion system protein VirB6
MAAACFAAAPGASIAGGLVDYVECHAGALGQVGFSALAGGHLLPTFLTGCLTIYVALVAYRLMLGNALSPRDGVLASVRAGLVLTFCLSWPSYEAVIYRVVVDGPAEIAKAVLEPSGIASLSAADAASKLQSLYEAIQTSNAPPSAMPAPPIAAPPGPGGMAVPPSPLMQPPLPAEGSTQLTTSGVILMVSTLGPYLAVRLAAALLLAVGPIVIALALFDPFLGLLEGWIRGLLGVTLGMLSVMLVTALEVGFLDARIATTSANEFGVLGGPGLILIGAVFGIASWGVLLATTLVARGFRIRRLHWGTRDAATAPQTATAQIERTTARGTEVPTTLTPSRAQGVADAVAAQSLRGRETATVVPFTPSRSISSGPGLGDPSRGYVNSHAPLGSTLRRTAIGRGGASNSRRDIRR